MDDLYREHILDHYHHPRNFGKLPNPTISISDSLVSCGDQLQMDLLIADETVVDCVFSGIGCAISMASASLLTDEIKGKKVADLRRLSANDMMQMIGITLTPSRVKCALLSLEILHKALSGQRLAV